MSLLHSLESSVYLCHSCFSLSYFVILVFEIHADYFYKGIV